MYFMEMKDKAGDREREKGGGVGGGEKGERKEAGRGRESGGGKVKEVRRQKGVKGEWEEGRVRGRENGKKAREKGKRGRERDTERI